MKKLARAAMRRWTTLRPHRASRPLRHVFVVTYGRSGSTLVQGLLNALPRVLVRGENGFFVLSLFRAADTASAFREKHLDHSPRRVSSAFYGVHGLARRRFVNTSRHLITQTLLADARRGDVDVLGFKEVLWHQIEPEETDRFFDFLEEVFPQARYVLNQRDHSRVLSSGFWQRRDSDHARAAIARVEEIQEFLRRTRPDRVLDLTYEAITGDDEAATESLRDLARFVVGRCDETILRGLRATFDTGHGPYAFGRSRDRGDGPEGTDAAQRPATPG